MDKKTREKVFDLSRCELVSLKPKIEHNYNMACENHSIFSTLVSRSIVEGEPNLIKEFQNSPGMLQLLLQKACSEAKARQELLLPMLTLVKHPDILSPKNPRTKKEVVRPMDKQKATTEDV